MAGPWEFWAHVLPAGSTVTGIDVNPKVGELTFDNLSIRVIVADATKAEEVSTAIGSATFDIIIDDGSHRCEDVISSLNVLFPRLRLDGCYVVEDLHTSYHAPFGGGFKHADSSIEYLKRAVDLLHKDHMDPAIGNDLKNALPTAMGETLASITFYDSLAVLRKTSQPKARPWRRLISGREAAVVPFASWIKYFPPTALSDIWFGQFSARNFETAYLEAYQVDQHRDDTLLSVRHELSATKAQMTDLALSLSALQADIINDKTLSADDISKRLSDLCGLTTSII